MKIAFTKLIHVLAIAGAIICGGCATTSNFKITPREAGIAAGTAAYLGYERIAEKKDQEFRDKVAEVWAEIDAIETKEELVEKVDLLTVAFNEVLKSEKLTDADRALLITLEQLVLEKVKVLLAEKLNDEELAALEFLIGARDGIRNMIKYTKEAE